MKVLNFLLARLRHRKKLGGTDLAMCVRAVVHLGVDDQAIVDVLSHHVSRDIRRNDALVRMLKFLLAYSPSSSVSLVAFMEILPERIAFVSIPHIECISAAIAQSRMDNYNQYPDVLNALLGRMQTILHLIQMDEAALTSFHRSLQYLFRASSCENTNAIAAMSGQFLRKYQYKLGNTKCIFLSALSEIAKHGTLLAEFVSSDFILLQKTHLIRAYDVQFITSMLYKHRLYLSFDLWERWVTELETLCFSLEMNPQKFLSLFFYIPREVWSHRGLRMIINRLSIHFLQHDNSNMIIPLLGSFFVLYVRFNSLGDGNRSVIQAITEILCANMCQLTSLNLYSVVYGVYKLDSKESFLAKDLVESLVTSISQQIDTFSPGQLTRIVYMLARGGHSFGNLLAQVCDHLFDGTIQSLHLREINLLLFGLLSAYTRDPLKIHAKKLIRYTFRHRIDCGEDPVERGNFFRHALTLFTRMGFTISPVVDYAVNILDEILQSVKPAYLLDMLATLALLSSSRDVHRKTFENFSKQYSELPLSRYKLLTAILSTPPVSSQADVQFFCKMVSDLARCSEKWEKSHHILSVMQKVNHMNVQLPFEFSSLWMDLCTTTHIEIQSNTESSDALSNLFRIFIAGLKEMASANCLCDRGPIESVIRAASANCKVHVSHECFGKLMRALAQTTKDPLDHEASTYLSEILLTHAGNLSAANLAAALHCSTRIFSIGDVNRREICQIVMDVLCRQFQENSRAELAYSIIADFDAISMKIRSSLLRKLLVSIAEGREIAHESPAVKFVRYLSSTRIEDYDDPLLQEFVESMIVRTLRSLLSQHELTSMGCSRILHYLLPVQSKYPQTTPYLEAFEKRLDKSEQYC
ncbi:hypothetical protein XU18_2137 [Perkinsela sp. CCAP 1560/4]|nr:hypothetical protein XU18_2137 [Perkinsela sp. CCAP 1560/4]|eukprot:KNH07161.1 hypothetical protein XU18_2137 [Perkinsela sp. CCAP 1560/4]